MINIDRRDNIFKDNIAYVERYDCSKNNMDDESRILAVTKIASVCYNKEASLGKKSLFDRLASESMGLPSSSFEFIPVLFKWDDIVLSVQIDTICKYTIADTNILKYGMLLTVNDVKYLLTNYRALVYDYEEFGIDYRNTYNTSEEEQKIISDNYYIFRYNIDLPTMGQLVRHRVNHQILCISGDSMIPTSQGPRPISELYRIQEEQRSKYKNYKHPTVKSYDFTDKIFKYVPIKEVFSSGKKEVFEVTIQYGTAGKTRTLKATKDHKFYTKEGWLRLEDISEGSYLALNGALAYRSKDWLESMKVKFLELNIGMKGMAVALNLNYNTLKSWIHKHNLSYTPLEVAKTFTVWNKNKRGKDSHSFGRMHTDETKNKISERQVKPLRTTKRGFASRIRSYWEADFRRAKVLEAYKHKCNVCDSTESLELDHIRPVCTHPELGFDFDNVQILCSKCHMSKTTQEIIASKTTIRYGRVSKIELIGVEDTYDLEVDHPDHNYVANSIVVHNSRRYVSGKKLSFSFYVSEKMKQIISRYTTTDRNNHSLTVEYNTNDIIDICLNHYYTAIDSGVKAEDARRIIPQAAYTTGWIGFNKKQLKSFLGLRTEYHAQPEIRELAISIQSMIG